MLVSRVDTVSNNKKICTKIRKAKKYGVKFVVDTDAHDLKHMDNMKYGVAVARRGWAEKKDIVNTLAWLEFKKIFTP